MTTNITETPNPKGLLGFYFWESFSGSMNRIERVDLMPQHEIVYLPLDMETLEPTNPDDPKIWNVSEFQSACRDGHITIYDPNYIRGQTSGWAGEVLADTDDPLYLTGWLDARIARAAKSLEGSER